VDENNFHPVGGFTVPFFHNGDLRHCRGCRCAVPMFLPRREPIFCRSAIGHLLQVFGVSIPLHRDL
jgi:hypothetical protein